MTLLQKDGVLRRILTLSLLPVVLAGCRGEPFQEGGPEIRYLTSTPPPARTAISSQQPLLPLTVGAVWEMTPIGKHLPKIVGRVVGKDASGGTMIEFRRNGTLWRREVYKNTSTGLFLTALGEDSKPAMQLSPPVPVCRYPLREGDGQTWTGTFRYGNYVFPGESYSRISALESVVGPSGKIQAYRIDTQIAINQDGRLTKFPTLQWLVPGTGFVRRSFVDEGHPLYVKLDKFTQR